MSIEEHKIQMEQLLEVNQAVPFKGFRDIADAFQVASGQGYAIGKTLGMLSYIKKGHTFLIKGFEGSDVQVRTTAELADLFKHLDPYLDLKTEKAFAEYL